MYEYDAANRLTRAGNRHYDYDVNGNLFKEHTSTELITYRYTHDNRIAGYQVLDLRPSKQGKAEDVPDIQQTYRYDALGRRVSLTSLDTRHTLPESRYEQYEYEGMGFSFARLQFSAVSGGNDLRKGPSDPGGTRYRPAPDSGSTEGTLSGSGPESGGTASDHRSASSSGSHRVIHARGRVAGRVSVHTDSWSGSHAGTTGDIVYSHDRLGSVVRESGAAGAAAQEYSYDAFGASIGLHSPQFFGYTGKPYDPITGMYDYGFRDYTPQAARFTTVDPIRDGSNWYAYVGNDPVNFVDLFGLEMLLLVDKDRQEMYVIRDQNLSTLRTIGITTGVVSRNSEINTNTARELSWDGNTTNPTQFPNGTFNVTVSAPNPTASIYYGDTWLVTDATQTLVDVNTGKEVIASGYNIHLTPHTNTNGCIGVKNYDDMMWLVREFENNETNDPQSTKISVHDHKKNK